MNMEHDGVEVISFPDALPDLKMPIELLWVAHELIEDAVSINDDVRDTLIAMAEQQPLQRGAKGRLWQARKSLHAFCAVSALAATDPAPKQLRLLTKHIGRTHDTATRDPRNTTAIAAAARPASNLASTISCEQWPPQQANHAPKKTMKKRIQQRYGLVALLLDTEELPASDYHDARKGIRELSYTFVANAAHEPETSLHAQAAAAFLRLNNTLGKALVPGLEDIAPNEEARRLLQELGRASCTT